jgi:hypothetical protein
LGVSTAPNLRASTLSPDVLYGPGIVNTDFSVLKNTRIREAWNAQFRVEIFNLFNHTIFGNPVANILSPAYGQLQSTRVPGREIQLGLKLLF